jgi:hypothetical protein
VATGSSWKNLNTKKSIIKLSMHERSLIEPTNKAMPEGGRMALLTCNVCIIDMLPRGRYFSRKAQRGRKNCVGPGKSGAELLEDLSKKGLNGAELFFIVWFSLK